jgi:glc operon protein GlcG
MSQASNTAFSVSRKNISLAGAQQVIAAAQAAAVAGGWHISVAVVDLAVQLVAFAKDDAAIGISPEVAIAKTRTAAHLQIPSKDFDGLHQRGPTQLPRHTA